MIGIRKLAKLLGHKEKALKKKLQEMNVLHADNTITKIATDQGIARSDHDTVYYRVDLGVSYSHNIFDEDRIASMIINNEALPESEPEIPKEVELPF
ncbi:MAG TPA: hypothetical protein VK658_01095 [Chryseolinea sp.]|nr:hypothetical protein [Chryseolinea sp.]